MEILGGFFCRFLPFYIHLLKFLRCVGGEGWMEGGVVVFTGL